MSLGMHKEKTALEKKIHYVNGQTISQCRRLCRFFFGSFLKSVDLDAKNFRFLIFVWESIYDEIEEVDLKLKEEVDIEHFVQFWCNTSDGERWKIVIIKQEEIKKK